MAYAFKMPDVVTDTIYSMREWMPRRPGHNTQKLDLNFCMDFENSLLVEWDARNGIPKGPRRYENARWAMLVKSRVFPAHSDLDWDEYVAYCPLGGDEWFWEEDGALASPIHKSF